MKPAPASAIEGLVESLFAVPAAVEQFIPKWYDIDERDRSRLGVANSRLGADINLGARIRLTQAKFRVRLGPMEWDRYESLLPGSEGLRALSSVTRLAAGPEVDFDLQLLLKARDVPQMRLESDPERRCRLGFSTWLKTEEFHQDADDAIFAPSLCAREPQGAIEVSP